MQQQSALTWQARESQQKLDAALALLDHLRSGQAALESRLLALFPAYVDEFGVQPNGTILTVQAQSRNVERITSILAVTSTAGGQLTLGTRSIPLPIGVSIFHGLSLILHFDDPRQLTQNSAGYLYLELMGEQVPTLGTLK